MQQAEGLYFFFAANAIDGTVQDKVNGANTSSSMIVVLILINVSAKTGIFS